KEALQMLFPQIPVEREQVRKGDFTEWSFILMRSIMCLLEKLKEAEESHGSLQAECEQYRTVLAETEGMLKHLQKSVEEEELVWKSKMAKSEEQLQEVSDNTYVTLNIDCIFSLIYFFCSTKNKNTNICSCLRSVQLKLQLSERQSQLDLARKEAEAHKEELAQVTAPSLKSCLFLLFEQERLEKEKKLSKDLGQAATKLQQLLKATQEQLTKERETVRTLQEHLENKGGYVELKEGTSV
uniref:Ribosome binding protein 1a n=1 Tax=Amphilophus citrinellus TaxID=61819 RepID=A0A3Q0RNQ9_AMPCI